MSTGNRSSRHGTRKVSKVVEHALDRCELAVDCSLECFTILGVLAQLEDQPATVRDVLNGMGNVVDQPRCDPTEHRLSLLPTNILFEVDQLVRSGPRNLDSGLSEISIVFQAAVPKPVVPKYTASGVRRPSEL